MGLGDIERESILQAIAEYDSLGRDAFLEKYGFERSRQYFLSHDGHLYDSKAIVGAAHGLQLPSQGPLRPSQFSGGDATVARLLRSLGFDIVKSEKEKEQPPAGRLGKHLQQILEMFPKVRLEPFGVKPELWAAFENLRAALEVTQAISSRDHVRVKWSPGTGNWAKVPWIALLDERETETATPAQVVYETSTSILIDVAA